jgi:3-hydroxybutyryl-CoA dehydrogenase
VSTELDEKAETFRVIGVLGAGQMGGGIAQVAAASGYDVRLADASLELASKGKEKVGAALAKQVDKGKMSADMRDSLLARITPTDGAAGFTACDLVVEAATESFDLKVKLLQACDAAMPRHAILASNTSSISITKLAAGTGRPDQVIGMHFFNPVPVMALVEVIRGLQTSDATFATVRALALDAGKTPVEVNDSAGFVSNRVLMPLLNEAMFAVMEGVATAEAVDEIFRLGMAHPMGPLTLADFIGLDVCLDIMRVLEDGLGDPKYRPCPLLIRMVDAGWLGRKSGRGFYQYTGK